MFGKTNLFDTQPSSMIEPEFDEPFKAWKADPTPGSNATMLKTLKPVIEGAVKTHVGENNPLLYSRAKRLALEGLRTYDPMRGRLKTHLYGQLQGLKRINQQQTQILKVPERVALDRYHLDMASQELASELGREPSDAEIAERTGLSPRRLMRIRQYQPGVAEGSIVDPETGGGYSGAAQTPDGEARNAWMQMIYDDLDPHHQVIMELTLGLNGHRPLSNQEIAQRLKRSPGAISQAKARIQKMLDEEPELSPFNGGLG
jgi:AraC-like DNA-binding protein